MFALATLTTRCLDVQNACYTCRNGNTWGDVAFWRRASLQSCTCLHTAGPRRRLAAHCTASAASWQALHSAGAAVQWLPNEGSGAVQPVNVQSAIRQQERSSATLAHRRCQRRCCIISTHKLFAAYIEGACITTSSKGATVPSSARSSFCTRFTADPKWMMAPSWASSLRVSTVVLPTVLRYHDTASPAAARLHHSSGSSFAPQLRLTLRI
jgi:hypothetical protein